MAGTHKAHTASALLALAIGLLFLLPHLVRIHRLGSYAAYSPFSALSPSPMVWDETFLYGAQVNYSLAHRTLANDTDTWEHRNQPYPYSILPIAAEALLARAVGSAKSAHLLCAFLFPALTAFLLLSLFAGLGAPSPLAALLALVVLVGGFSPATLLLDDQALLHHLRGSAVVDSLQASRTPNPNLTFPLFLAALLCLTHAIRRARQPQNPALPARTPLLFFLAAGVLGGLLFFSYIFYAVAWCAAIALLALLSLIGPRLAVPGSAIPRATGAALAATSLLALPFLWWKHLSAAAGAYLPRSLRTGLQFGHALHPKALALTAAYLVFAAFALAAWRWIDTRTHPPAPGPRALAAALIPVLLATLAGTLAGLNMQLLTGFNVQAEHHFPHMVLQPIALILLSALLLLAAPRIPRVLASSTFALFFAACAAAQVADGIASAPDHRLPADDQTLFTFLNRHTPAGSVVATDNLRLSIELPTFTHNRLLFANGTRSTASDAELLDRFLLASRLAAITPDTVRAELSQQDPGPRPAPQIPTYTYYLFETSAYQAPDSRRIAAPLLPAILAQYQALNLPAELQRYRVDFLWTDGSSTPPRIEGWSSTPVLTIPSGQLWSLTSASQPQPTHLDH